MGGSFACHSIKISSYKTGNIVKGHGQCGGLTREAEAWEAWEAWHAWMAQTVWSLIAMHAQGWFRLSGLCGLRVGQRPD